MTYLWPPGSRIMMDFLLTRHGETLWNVEQRIQGRTDIPLTERGEEQARLLARRLEGTLIDAIYSSDLVRATRTAEIIREKVRAPLETDPALRERNWGNLEGLTWKEIVGDHPDAAAQIKAGSMDFAPEGGESRYQVIRRVLDWLNRTVEANEGKTILTVTHGGVSAYIVKNALDIDLNRRTPFTISNCSLTSMVYADDSFWFITKLNDTSHLEEAQKSGI
ncbi:MAG: histidine phosphatase family protein [bacterium]